MKIRKKFGLDPAIDGLHSGIIGWCTGSDIDLVCLHVLEAVVALGCIDRLKFSNVDVCL